MGRAITRGGTAIALVAVVALGLLQIEAGDAVAKKKRKPWWGTFTRSGRVFEPRPGYTWNVNFTLQVTKKKGRWSINDAVGRLNCWDGSTSEGTVEPTSEYFEFAIPPIGGKLGRFVGVDGGPFGVSIAELTGQTPTGRGFRVSVGRRDLIFFPAKGRWKVEWVINWQCDGGAFIGGVRVIPTYATRR
jgi:hypothetical protein